MGHRDIKSEIKGNSKAKQVIHTGFAQKREKPRSNEKKKPGSRQEGFTTRVHSEKVKKAAAGPYRSLWFTLSRGRWHISSRGKMQNQ